MKQTATSLTLATFVKVALIFAAVCALSPAFAQDLADHSGYFNVRSATTTLNGDVRELDARLQLVLSGEADDALTSGVPLTIELNIEVIRSRRFWPDAMTAELNLQ